jgi:hypothetical protein
MPFPHDKGNAYQDANHLPLAVMWKQGIPKPGRSLTDIFREEKAGRVSASRDQVLIGKERTDIGRPRARPEICNFFRWALVLHGGKGSRSGRSGFPERAV